MSIENSASVQRGLSYLAERLDPILQARLGPTLQGLHWPVLLTELDRAKGRTARAYSPADLQAQLRVLTERLGNLGYPLDDHERRASTLGSELRVMRNRWAHNDKLDALDAWRTHDFVVRLLEYFGDDEGVGEAIKLREGAFQNIARWHGTDPVSHSVPTPTRPAANIAKTVAAVRPDPKMTKRPNADDTPTIGSERSAFEPWTVVAVGVVEVLDDLPRAYAKEQVQSLAREITEFEGPIHVDRLATLTAASFNLHRLHAKRKEQLSQHFSQTGLLVDRNKFVWPEDIDPEKWREFRPNDSEVERPFEHISPVEIANAARFLRDHEGVTDREELEVQTLQTFGRKRRTEGIMNHLNLALGTLEK